MKFYAIDIYISLHLVSLRSLNTFRYLKKNLECVFRLVAMRTIKSNWDWEYNKWYSSYHSFLIHLLVSLGLQNNVNKMTSFCPSTGLNSLHTLPSPSLPPSLSFCLADLEWLLQGLKPAFQEDRVSEIVRGGKVKRVSRESFPTLAERKRGRNFLVKVRKQHLPKELLCLTLSQARPGRTWAFHHSWGQVSLPITVHLLCLLRRNHTFMAQPIPSVFNPWF